VRRILNAGTRWVNLPFVFSVDIVFRAADQAHLRELIKKAV
jgi:hypothetical protein